AEITIHVRDDSVQNPRGLKAFRVTIAPDSGGAGTAKLAVENLKMPEPTANHMKEDVQRWSRGDIARAEPGSEWAPKPAPVADNGKKKRKPAKKAAQNDI